MGGGGFGEGDDFADGFFAGEEHDDAVEAERDAAVRRSAVGQRVEEEAEAAAELFFGEAERFEEALLHVLAMNSDAAAAEFDAVEDEVVAFAANFPRCGLELVDVFFDDAGERMLRAGPGLLAGTPFEEREAGEPEKFPLRFVDLVEGFAEDQAELAGDERGGIGAFDFGFGGDGDDEIAGFRFAGLRELCDVFGAD